MRPARECFWRFARIAESWFRRMGKALVPQPTVATEDDEGNEFGRCNVCRANCFRGSTNDLCQVCLRCNVDYQYQNRSFPDIADQPEPSAAVRYDTQTVLQSTRDDSRPVGRARLPRVLRGLTRHAGIAVATGTRLLMELMLLLFSSRNCRTSAGLEWPTRSSVLCSTDWLGENSNGLFVDLRDMLH